MNIQTSRYLIPVLVTLCLAATCSGAAEIDIPADGIPVPQERPAHSSEAKDPAPAAAPKAEDQETEDEPPDPPPPEPDEAALAACEAQLKSLGAVFERKDPVDGPGSCGLPASYEISEILRGVAIEPVTEFRCATALATARWLGEVVIPAAKVLGDDVRLTGIRQASTYVCRNRNGQPDAKISEHARGNAIDVATFRFAGRDSLVVVPEQRKGSPEEAFQKAVRAGACLHFTTVLGPGADAFHDDHLHLDLAARRGGYRLCQ